MKYIALAGCLLILLPLWFALGVAIAAFIFGSTIRAI